MTRTNHYIYLYVKGQWPWPKPVQWYVLTGEFIRWTYPELVWLVIEETMAEFKKFAEETDADLWDCTVWVHVEEVK